MKKHISLFICFVLMFTMSLGLVSCSNKDESGDDLNAQNYEKALVMLANGDYTGAKEAFEKLGDYRDSKEYLSKFYYMPTSFEYELIDKKGKDYVSYNNIGLPQTQAIMRPDAQAIYNYFYDEKGNIIQQHVTINGEEVQEVYIYEYIYNDAGQRVRAEFEFHGGITGFQTFTYDENGNLIKRNYEDSTGLVYEYLSEYNEKGQRTRFEIVFNGASDVRTTSYEYDENGMTVKETTSYQDGFVEIWDYTYDENGNRISAYLTDSDGDHCRYDYTYDEHGNTIKEEYVGYSGTKQYVKTEYELMYLPCGVTAGTELFFVEVWAERL